MGESIEFRDFTSDESRNFQKKLREETLLLKQMIESRSFEYCDKNKLGLEVEAYLLDDNFIPNPINKRFLNECDDPMIVEELAKFNFELNTPPLDIENQCLSTLHNQLKQTWDICTRTATKLNSKTSLIGIHPMVRDEMLQPEYMSEDGRYHTLNRQILKCRDEKPITIDIKGTDHLHLNLDHILIEAATTSIQVHIQANQENFKRIFNASILASIPCVALAANSPFLYGHELWHETRIPLFEQAVRLKNFRDKKGRDVGRVFFGTGYIRNSPLELFLENLDGFPPLMPILFDDKPEKLHHLRFHNGTLWRWTRPIVGFNKGQPHFRVEQRAMASGPTLTDIVANTAFSLGLTHYYANHEKAPEESMTFTDSFNNFYSAAKDGLEAKLRWFGKEQSMDKLILDDLIPKAIQGLQDMNVDNQEIQYYLNDIVRNRVLSGQNGSRWQRSFIHLHGKDFQSLAQAYSENQSSGEPVHKWKI